MTLLWQIPLINAHFVNPEGDCMLLIPETSEYTVKRRMIARPPSGKCSISSKFGSPQAYDTALKGRGVTIEMNRAKAVIVTCLQDQEPYLARYYPRVGVPIFTRCNRVHAGQIDWMPFDCNAVQPWGILGAFAMR